MAELSAALVAQYVVVAFVVAASAAFWLRRGFPEAAARLLATLRAGIGRALNRHAPLPAWRRYGLRLLAAPQPQQRGGTAAICGGCAASCGGCPVASASAQTRNG